MYNKFSYPKDKIEIVLSEKIDKAACDTFAENGYKVTEINEALEGEGLKKVLETAHIIGVRSRSKVTKDLILNSKRLLSIGCFTVGTDQVDLDGARIAGIPVFNAPHSSTRSVAELTLACIISLSRKLGDQNIQMHSGSWDKSAGGALEVRDKTLGIIGYGHIGQQVGLLAESLGLNVYFYDILKKLPLGRAKSVQSLSELYKKCDYISLHVPATQETENIICESSIKEMKKGAYIINHSRGKVINLYSLVDGIKNGQIGGAALDVFPSEPNKNSAPFTSPLQGLPNVILTPHIGGSTLEAQKNIGIEVAKSLISFLDVGSTLGAVNFPNVFLPSHEKTHRILNIHKNIPGALSEITQVISEVGANIESQYLGTNSDVGYLIMDINQDVSEEIRKRIAELPKSIKTRMLF